MTSKHKSEDYKLSAVEYYLDSNKSQLEVGMGIRRDF
jgi:hypothetical protein